MPNGNVTAQNDEFQVQVLYSTILYEFYWKKTTALISRRNLLKTKEQLIVCAFSSKQYRRVHTRRVRGARTRIVIYLFYFFTIQYYLQSLL